MAVLLLRCTMMALCIAAMLPASAAPPDEALLQSLREGALTIYFRHGKTDPEQKDQRGAAPGDCAAQRNLSDEGHAQARAIGAALRAMALEIEEEVAASPYCRTMDTARLIFGRATPSRAILGTRTPEGKVDHAVLASLLAKPPPKPRIRVVVAHGNQLSEVSGEGFPRELAEGEAAIIRGDGTSWIILTTVAADDWPRLAEMAAKR
jgi:phosphohistidine phosphatase SixA